MLKRERGWINARYSIESYRRFLGKLNTRTRYRLPFRVAETPVFVPRYLEKILLEAGEHTIGWLMNGPLGQTKSMRGLDETIELDNTPCIAVDFAIVKGNGTRLSCRLVEYQVAMSLYGLQHVLANEYSDHYRLSQRYSPYLSGLDFESYIQTLKSVLVGDHDPENVVILEVQPSRQANVFDMFCIGNLLRLKTLCISDVRKRGNNLSYKSGGRWIRINRICNRIVPEELLSEDANRYRNFLDPSLDVEWVCHPSWWYKVTKASMATMKGRYFLETSLLSNFPIGEENTSHYVLKPVQGRGGEGVVLDVTTDQLTSIRDPEEYVVQRKIDYARCIKADDGFRALEIRLMYVWRQNDSKPIPVITLARLSDERRMALRYNLEKSWTGLTVCMFSRHDL